MCSHTLDLRGRRELNQVGQATTLAFHRELSPRRSSCFNLPVIFHLAIIKYILAYCKLQCEDWWQLYRLGIFHCCAGFPATDGWDKLRTQKYDLTLLEARYLVKLCSTFYVVCRIYCNDSFIRNGDDVGSIVTLERISCIKYSRSTSFIVAFWKLTSVEYKRPDIRARQVCEYFDTHR